MNKLLVTLICVIMLPAIATDARAHDVVDSDGKPLNTHQHVWRQQAYGMDYRQGHSVSSHRGSITTWSPNTYRGYNAGRSVKFARPVPMTARPGSGYHAPLIKSQSRQNYGQSSQRDPGR